MYAYMSSSKNLTWDVVQQMEMNLQKNSIQVKNFMKSWCCFLYGTVSEIANKETLAVFMYIFYLL